MSGPVRVPVRPNRCENGSSANTCVWRENAAASMVWRAFAINERCERRAPRARPSIPEVKTTAHSSSRPPASLSTSTVRPTCEPRSIVRGVPSMTRSAVRGASSRITCVRPGGSRPASARTVNTAPTPASAICSAISVGAANGLISTAPRPSLAASAVTKAGHEGISRAERLPPRARTSAALRWRRVNPAATRAWAGIPSTEPPPAAIARGSSVSESFTGGKVSIGSRFAICTRGIAGDSFIG